MRITFASDKSCGKPHYKVCHPNMDERELREVFDGALAVFGRSKSVLKAIGRTRAGRFLTVVFVRRRPDSVHLITAWPSNQRQILIWHQEMQKS
jgi:hypothetical protein